MNGRKRRTEHKPQQATTAQERNLQKMAKIIIKTKEGTELTFNSLNEVISKHFKKPYGMNTQSAQRYILNQGCALTIDGVEITSDNIKTSAPSKTSSSIMDRILKELASVDNAQVKRLQEELTNQALQVKTIDDIEKLENKKLELTNAMNPPKATLDAVIDYVVNLYIDHTTAQPEPTAEPTEPKDE